MSIRTVIIGILLYIAFGILTDFIIEPDAPEVDDLIMVLWPISLVVYLITIIGSSIQNKIRRK